MPVCAASDKRIDALRAIERADWSNAARFVSRSQDPLLQKIYHWRNYQHDKGHGGFEAISAFIRDNPAWPETKAMRMQLEARLRGDEDLTALAQWFDEHPPLTAKGVEAYAKALFSLNKHTAFRAFLNDWWATTIMSREDQVYVYRRFHGAIDRRAHVKRFDKLLFNQQYTNARAIAKVLGQGYPQLAEARIALAAKKNGVDRLIDAIPAARKRDAGLLYERLKWRREKGMDTRAIEILNNPPAYRDMTNPQDWWRERHIIIRRLLERQEFRKAARLAAGHVQQEGFAYAQAQWLAGWLALRYERDAASAFKRFVELEGKVSTPVSKARARYWAGRAAKTLGEDGLAALWFEKASHYQTTYYGQKSLDHVSNALMAASYMVAPRVSSVDRGRWKRHDALAAAALYDRAGFEGAAGDFLWAFARHEGSAPAHMYAIERAAEFKNYKDVVALSKRASQKGLFVTKQAYPTVIRAMHHARSGAEWALLHALMRQESRFDPQAKSPAGALGLMQIMPATAKHVAKQKRLRHRKNWLTDKPAHNIKLGSHYIYDLVRRYEGSYILAIAAYNAGPGRVNSWLKTIGDPRDGSIDPIDWIELIPIYETRNYVQRVSENLHVYRALLKGKQPDVRLANVRGY